MTREDLEREAYIYTQEKMVHYSADQNEVIEMLAEFTAKQQNKRIKALEQENADLKKQIENMKCCYNCSKWNDGECSESPEVYTMADFECETWELKE